MRPRQKAFKLRGELAVYLQGKQLDIASEVKILGVVFHFADSNFLLSVPDDKVELRRRLSWLTVYVSQVCLFT